MILQVHLVTSKVNITSMCALPSGYLYYFLPLVAFVPTKQLTSFSWEKLRCFSLHIRRVVIVGKKKVALAEGGGGPILKDKVVHRIQVCSVNASHEKCLYNRSRLRRSEV